MSFAGALEATLEAALEGNAVDQWRLDRMLREAAPALLKVLDTARRVDHELASRGPDGPKWKPRIELHEALDALDEQMALGTAS